MTLQHFNERLIMIKYVILLTGLLLLLLGCKSEKSDQVEQMKISNQETSLAETGIPDLDNDFLVSIYEAQELIKMEHDNIDLRKKYCQKAYLKEQGYFITMGIAVKNNPETGQAIAASLVERVATIDAMRWASYGQQWIKNDYEPAFGKIQAKTNPNITILNRANVGDSLFVFMATKVD
jgi:hypothetical protein